MAECAPLLRHSNLKTRAVKIALDRDKVTLSVTSPENGLAVEELAADYGSDGLEIGFNARYLMDILHEIEGDTVEVKIPSGTRTFEIISFTTMHDDQ